MDYLIDIIYNMIWFRKFFDDSYIFVMILIMEIVMLEKLIYLVDIGNKY